MKTYSLLIIFLAALLSSGCSRPEDPVKKDFLLYLEEMTPIVGLEEEALRAFVSVTGDKYQGDEALRKVFKETVIPKYNSFAEGLREIRPSTNEVSGLHRLYLRRADLFLAGVNGFVEAVGKGSPELAQEAKQKLSDGTLTYQKWLQKVDELKKRLGKE